MGPQHVKDSPPGARLCHCAWPYHLVTHPGRHTLVGNGMAMTTCPWGFLWYKMISRLHVEAPQLSQVMVSSLQWQCQKKKNAKEMPWEWAKMEAKHDPVSPTFDICLIFCCVCTLCLLTCWIKWELCHFLTHLKKINITFHGFLLW